MHYSTSCLFLICTAFTFFIQLQPGFACEGQCITEVTRVFVGNYSNVMKTVLHEMANKMEDERSSGKVSWMKQKSAPGTAMGSSRFDFLLEPYLQEFNSRAPAVYQHAIFPSHFHGKCQNLSTGIDPPGCPNPDCPVVCGTPGSMVHFYDDLIEIALNSALSMAKELAKPQSSSYMLLVQALEDRPTRPRRLLRFSRTSVGPKEGGLSAHYRESPNEFVTRHMESLPHMVKAACNRNQANETDAMGNCRWETEMKKFILSFP